MLSQSYLKCSLTVKNLNNMQTKHLVFGIIIVASMIMISCEKSDSLVEYNKIESTSKSEKSALIEKSVKTRSSASYFWDIVNTYGWTLDESRNGVALFHKNGNYAVMADLSNGAKFGMVFDTPSNQGNANAKFNLKSLSSWNNYGNFFAIANSCFFRYDGYNTPKELPFPLKQGGILHSWGNDGSMADRNKVKSTLNIHNEYAEILEIGTHPMQRNLMTTNKSYAGFASYEGNSKYINTRRTFVGLKDFNGDGKRELLWLLVTSPLKHNVAKAFLEDDFDCDQIITFDGGGSSQLICDEVSRISSSRPIPVTMVIKERGVN